MSNSRRTGYSNQRSYGSNGSYRTVYTSGSAAPRYEEQLSYDHRRSTSRSRSTEQYYRSSRSQAAARSQAAPRYREVPQRRPEYRPRQPQRISSKEANRRRHIAYRNQQRAMTMNLRYVVFLATAVVICCLLCGGLLKAQSDLTATSGRVTDLEQQIAELRQENDARESSIDALVNLDSVKEDAEALGMEYATNDQIIYFSLGSTDYVNDFRMLN